MTNNPLNIEKYNKILTRRGFTIRVNLKKAISMLSRKGKKDLVKSLRLRVKKEYGEITQLSYQFNRHGVFFHKGVGRGHVIQGRRVVRGTKTGGIFKPLPSLSDTEINRDPKDWFNPILEKEAPKLADLIAKHKADQAGETIIKIK